MQLEPFVVGGGIVSSNSSTRLQIPPARARYANAQLDDYQDKARHQFPHHPPTEVSLLARTSAPAPLGTLGFGLWNDPLGVALDGGGGRFKLPAMPQALWFFYGSPPNLLPLQAGEPTHGWFASSLRSRRWPSLLLPLAAALGLALSRIRRTRKFAVQVIRRQMSASGARLSLPLNEWHQYRLRWQSDRAEFWVDDTLVHVAADPPAGPLGFVAWIDNQYAALSAEAGLRFGLVPTDRSQSLEVRQLEVG